MDFFAIHIFLKDAVQADLLIGQLDEMGFTGFEERDDRLIACIPALGLPEKYDALTALLAARQLRFEVQPLPSTNWNAVWESSFSPVRIDDFCGIRAAFHPPVEGVKYEMVITPRMTFGTGHHATTASMIRLMKGLDLRGRSVLDFGTGTGILAILAAKMGATGMGVDHDPAAVSNAKENALENGVAAKMDFICGDRPGPGTFDCILVNIQLQVILQNLEGLLGRLRPGGWLLLGGVLEKNEPYLEEAAGRYHLEIIKRSGEQGWVALMLKKQAELP